ncbi:MAG: phosphoribosylformylglycinamidine synthase I [Fimbriiglobus sp.]|jgi:phosphoribosylformylglycinamidine synthase|nr:phosphoribosylformylglycinamidine synthase I [Fimbriiglobus sp.]
MATPYALILRGPGTNCDREVEYAFTAAGAVAERVHIQTLRENPARLRDFQILVCPGGFSYGDDVGSGKIMASQLEHFLSDAIREFRDDEKLILGICNGFQTLLKAGLLVPPDEDGPLATLTHNDSGRYVDRWVHLKVTSNKSPFLKDVQRMFVPMAHGEGNFVARKEWILKGLGQAGQVVLRYTDPNGNTGAGYPHTPNGSQDDIAGICDATGRVLGLMPHPERHILPTQHPRWTREGLKQEGDGMQLFRNAVEYFG